MTTQIEYRQRLLSGNLTKRQAKDMKKRLEARIDECLRFYPWPALIASLQADLVTLRRYL